MKNIVATTYDKQGNFVEVVIFKTYPEALRWAGAVTGVTKPVCIKDNTAYAAHEPGKQSCWTITPVS
jgi:hypothetical protein